MYRVIKVLNNNGVLVYDMKREEEAILLGNGIGFGKRVNQRFERDENAKRYTIVDREEKNRSGRQVLSGMDMEFLELAGRIVELAKTELGELNPNILIPLSAAASRGDQILNARSFEKQGFSKVLEEEQITEENLLLAIKDTYENRQQYISAMKQSTLTDAVSTIIALISSYAEM